MHQRLVLMLLGGLARTEQKFTQADDKLVPGYFLNFLSPLTRADRFRLAESGMVREAVGMLAWQEVSNS